MSGELYLIHLVWEPLGPDRLASFSDSYRLHPAGVEHRLVLLLNGFREHQDLSPWRRVLGDIPHEELRLPEPVLDLAAYRQAVELLPADRYCFVNSYGVVRRDDWLALIDRHLSAAGAGIVGASGSLESAYSAAPRPLRPFRRDFDPFPNPHIRTNAFAMRGELLRSLEWPAPRRKLQALRLESGRLGISRQVRDRGLELLVVGADGAAYEPERWFQSSTFRSGGQVNKLLADNRTEEYELAGAGRREHLEQMTWGTRAGHAPAAVSR